MKSNLIQLLPFTTLALLSSVTLAAQTTSVWTIHTHESRASFRGLCVVNDQVVWASGSENTVVRSTDGGKSWMTVSPIIEPLGEKSLDFRSISAFDSRNAVIISAGTPARVYRTIDGGKRWRQVFVDNRPAAFFDAVAFWNRHHGIAFSDPIDGRLHLIRTRDGGKSWSILPGESRPRTLKGEAGFAASCSCLCVHQSGHAWIGLGGKHAGGRARVMLSTDHGRTWAAAVTPITSTEKSGIFSIAFVDTRRGVAVGGTYDKPDDATSNICITDDGGRSWQVPQSRPSGFRSCIAIRRIDEQLQLICVGSNGCDISTDFGNNWKTLSQQPFHAIAFSPSGTLGIAVGGDGKVGVWQDRSSGN